MARSRLCSQLVLVRSTCRATAAQAACRQLWGRSDKCAPNCAGTPPAPRLRVLLFRKMHWLVLAINARNFAGRQPRRKAQSWST
jgi:hypothetical protein